MLKMMLGRMRRKTTSLKDDQRGFTLVEVIVVLVILGILFSVIIPSMTGYINKAKEQKYVMEAQGVRQSIELYLLEEYAYDSIDMMEFLELLSAEELNSPDCVLADYMKVTCTEGANIQNLTLEKNGVHVCQMVYLVDGYKIEIGPKGTYSVSSVKK